MRNPRRTERIPAGGKRLAELLRMDHEPVFIHIFLDDEAPSSRLEMEDTLSYSREFDPMLYFWPVDRQHCVVQMRSGDEKSRARLAKALLRDGGAWISIISWDAGRLKIEHWGDKDEFMHRQYGGSNPMAAMGPPG